MVQRQRERDVTLLLQLLDGLSRPQMAILSIVQLRLRRYRQTAIPTLLDTDVRDAAAAIAATLETAAKGIVYEHSTPSLPAQRLVGVLREVERELEEHRVPPAVLGVVFRRLERGAQRADAMVGGGEVAFLDFIDRVDAGEGADPASVAAETGPGPAQHDPPRIIVP